MSSPISNASDSQCYLSSYKCSWCSKEIMKVQMKENQRIYCLSCLTQHNQPFGSDNEAMERKLKTMNIHSPQKAKNAQPVKMLQGIPATFFSELSLLSVEEGIKKVKTLLEGKFLLCVAAETKMYALAKRSSGETWSYGLVMRSKKPDTIAVCFNSTTKEGKYVPIESSLAIPSELMDAINLSKFSNTIEDENLLEKSFSFKALAIQFIEWAKSEDHA